MSDLLIEFQENSRYLKHNELPITGEVLVWAGDIFYLRNKVAPLAKLWKWALENYWQVLIVPGNHEYYNYSDVMKRGGEYDISGECWLLSESGRPHQCIDFVLSALWSRINPNGEYFVWNDFCQIQFDGKLMHTEVFGWMHETCIEFIWGSVKESTVPILYCGGYPPSADLG